MRSIAHRKGERGDRAGASRPDALAERHRKRGDERACAHGPRSTCQTWR